MNKTNIVVTSFNRIEATAKCIHSIRKHTSGNHVLTVVDDASTDGSQEYLKTLKKKGLIDTLLLFENNMGVAVAVNMGMYAHNTKYSVKLDNDIIVHGDSWLNDLVSTAEYNENIGVVAYDVYEQKQCGSVPFCGGSAMLITEEAKNLVGLFCEEYCKYGEEDSDYGFRIELAGLKNYYIPPKGKVEHDHEKRSYGSKDKDWRRQREARRSGIYQHFFNLFLYQNDIRPIKLRRRYDYSFTKDGKIRFSENASYKKFLDCFTPLKKEFFQKYSHAIEHFIEGN